MKDPLKPSAASYFSKFDAVLSDQGGQAVIAISLVDTRSYDDYEHRSPASFSRQMEQGGFTGKDRQVCVLRGEDGQVAEIVCGVTFPLSLYAGSVIFDRIRQEFSPAFLQDVTFKINHTLTIQDATQAACGWALASYRFERYKKSPDALPVLIWPAQADRARAMAIAEGLCLVKTLVNIPANDLGTEELADATAEIAARHGAVFKAIAQTKDVQKTFR